MKRILLLMLLVVFNISQGMARPLVIDKFPISQKYVALTLEDVEDEKTLVSIIEICQTEDIRVTLFCPGQFVQLEKERMERLLALGFELGICGVKYQPWDELREEEILREYHLAKKMLPQKTRQPLLAVRPPYGYYGESVLKAFTYSDEAFIIRGTSSGKEASAGDIINIRMNNEDALLNLRQIITELKAEGYKMETVNHLLENCNDLSSTL